MDEAERTTLRYIKDTDGFVKNALEKLEQEGEIKVAHIEKVKLRNALTRVVDVVKDVFIIATGRNGDKPLFVCGVREIGSELTHILHWDYNHMNMNTMMFPLTYKREGYILLVRSFCNPVTQCHIWDRPQDMAKILKGNLMENNPNDRWRNINSVDATMNSPRVYSSRDGFMNRKSTIQQIILRKDSIDDNVPREQLRKLKSILSKLKENHELCYAYITRNDRAAGWEIIEKSELDSPYVWVSNYYKVYDHRDVDALPEIEKRKIDVGIFGCGSAGSNIVEQLKRLTYFSSYMLVDYDKIEIKNLRNQAYVKQDISSLKVDALVHNIMRCTPINNVTKIERAYAKFEEAIDMYEETIFKYVICGFDSFSARLLLLDFIKSGKIECEYLIDTRYEDLSSSLFFINTKDKAQMEYYEKVLLQDKADYEVALRTRPAVSIPQEWTPEMVKEYLSATEVPSGNCSKMQRRLNCCVECPSHNCGDEYCIHAWVTAFAKYHVGTSHFVEECGAPSSCLAQNFIHIYGLTASWVTSGIRSVESEEGKPYTHVEITAEPIPAAMVLKK